MALVGGVPEWGSRGLLLVRHHPQQLLNLEADTLQWGTLENTSYCLLFARICERQAAPLGLGKGGCVILAAATYAT